VELERLCKRASKKCDQAEVFFSSSSQTLCRTILDSIETMKWGRSSGFGVRVTKNKHTGFSFTPSLKHFDDAVKRALRSARISPKEDFLLPDKSPKPKQIQDFDPDVAGLTESNILAYALDGMRGARRHAEPSQSEIVAAHGRVGVANSNGLVCKTNHTFFSAIVTAKKKDTLASADFGGKNMGATPRELGREAGQWARRAAGGKPCTFSGPVILSVDVLQNLFSSAIEPAVNGERVRKEKSIWSNNLNQKVTGNFDLYDDPFIPWGSNSAWFDDEGVGCKRKPIIKNGKLKNLLYDSRTANLVGAKSTGNGFRSGFAGIPSISPTNWVVVPRKQENIFHGKGVYVRDLMGYHNMNPDTGDFALSIVNGFHFNYSKLDKPVHGSLLTGNVFDLLENAVFGERSERDHWFHSPEVRIEAKIVGK